MKLPASKKGRFALFFAAEAVSFFFIAANFRAVAQGLYLWTGFTDMLLVLQSMVITRLMFEDERARDWNSIAGFSLGGAAGSMLSIYVTKHLWGT